MMTPAPDVTETAEMYLKEMLEADDSANFELYTKRFEPKYLGDFNKEIFSRDIKGMHERNGMNNGYEFMGTLRNASVDGLDIFRTVWKGIYEKRDALIEIALYKSEGEWYLIKSSVY